MGNIEVIVHSRDKEVYEKRVQTMPADDVVNELNYERELADFGVYHVKTDDTLAGIAHRFYLNAERLAFVNGIHDNTLHVGSVISLRDCAQ